MFRGESEYRRRTREKTEKNNRETKAKKEKTVEKSEIQKLAAAIQCIERELNRSNDEQTPQKKRDRRWEHFGVAGLWAAATVGAIAIWFGTHDAGEQRSVMAEQMNVMQAQANAMQGQLQMLEHQVIDARQMQRAFII